MAVILLIRHGENGLVASRMAGRLPGVNLNEKGRAQAEELAQRLKGLPIRAIYSSPLERAVETAEYLAGSRGLKIQTRDGLNEIDVGAWQDQKIDGLNKTDEWRMFQIYPSGARPPGGESGRQMQMRVVCEAEAICAEHPEGNVAIVSHADTIKAIMAHYAGIHLDLFQRLIISPASVSVIWLGPWGPRVIRFNDAGPLDEIKSPAEQHKPKESDQGKKEGENAG